MTATSLSPAFIEADEALEFLHIAIQDRYNRFSVREAMGRVRCIFNSGSEEVRYKLVTDLTAMKFAGVVPFLTDVLYNDESPLIRHEAAFGIGTLGSARDSAPLIHALKYDSSNMVRHTNRSLASHKSKHGNAQAPNSTNCRRSRRSIAFG